MYHLDFCKVFLYWNLPAKRALILTLLCYHFSHSLSCRGIHGCSLNLSSTTIYHFQMTTGRTHRIHVNNKTASINITKQCRPGTPSSSFRTCWSFRTTPTRGWGTYLGSKGQVIHQGGWVGSWTDPQPNTCENTTFSRTMYVVGNKKLCSRNIYFCLSVTIIWPIVLQYPWYYCANSGATRQRRWNGFVQNGSEGI